jgi:aryl-alcohol dehydrogenase-like predicted oxidoreductase
VPQLGQGTWHMGESGRMRKDELAALKLGLDLGMTLIDTAEMYGNGGTEEVVAEAVQGRRDECFISAGASREFDPRGPSLPARRASIYLLH